METNISQSILQENIDRILKVRKPILEALSRLNIHTVRDLILHKPLHVLHRKLFPNLATLETGDNVVLELEIKEISLARRGVRTPSKIYCENNRQQGILLIYFNKIPPFILSSLKVGSKKLVMGKVEKHLDYVQITHPEYLTNKETLTELEPIYSLTYGLNNRHLSALIQTTIKRLPNFEEWLPQEFKQRFNLINFNEALRLLHSPSKDVTLNEKAISRLAADELFANQLMLSIVRRLRQKANGRTFSKADALQQQILTHLGFELTDSQIKVINEIEQDQINPSKMMRILQGDVGAGKTLVALMTMVNVCVQGAQAALMVPTDILANQHYKFFEKSLEGTNIKVALLTGKTKAKARQEILNDLANNNVHILIGTHALFQEKVNFFDLGYIVIDEQHRFGVQQRLELMEKGKNADVLVMTATPIPRSLSLVLFGDMEISRLHSKPKGRLPIKTSCVGERKMMELIASLKNMLDQGQKVYWVCALIEKKEEGDEAQISDYEITDATLRANILDMHYPGKVALVHGKMPAAEKDKVMEKFRTGEKVILVATTVIEVGVDVPDATLIIIENAERFGLAQLHQLRGRVGRSELQSYCILIYGKYLSSVAKERLNIIKNSNDGFYIAEQDLKLRGGGEVLGTKQTGDQTFAVADIVKDLDILNAANITAAETLQGRIKLNKSALMQLFVLFNYNDFVKLINLN
jgi:ATP-dependent DNA helicase RecG